MKNKILLVPVIAMAMACSNDTEIADAYGHFEAENYIISAESLGKLVRLNVEEGDRLVRGDTIGLIDTIHLFLQKQKIMKSIEAVRQKTNPVESEIEVIRVKQRKIIAEIARFEKLMADSAVAPKKLDDLKSENEILESQMSSVRTKLQSVNMGILSEIEPLKAQFSIINNSIEKCFIVSPGAGLVNDIYLKEGELATPGKPVIKLSDVDNMFMRSYLSGRQLSDIKRGQKVTVKYDGPEGIVSEQAEVFWISEEAEFTPKTIQTRDERVNLVYATKVRMKNNGYLKSGMPAELWLSNNKENYD